MKWKDGRMEGWKDAGAENQALQGAEGQDSVIKAS
jgi:hypothetical protein